MKEGTIDSLRVREKAVMPELDVLRCGEDPSHMEYQPCCGDCCWFYGEDADGNGSCAMHEYDGDELPWYYESSLACPEHTSRKEMRHHMAVLLQRLRFQEDDSGYSFTPKRKFPFGVFEAIRFAYRYMKVFSKL